MKKLFIIPFTIALFACENQPQDASDIDLEDFKSRISYALGADMGTNFSNLPEDISNVIDRKALEDGFYEMLTSEDEKSDECQDILRTAFGSREGIDTTKNSMKEISHCYGSIFGEMMRNSLTSKNAYDQIDPDISKIGFASALNSTDTLIPMKERNEMIMDFNNDLNKLAGEEFISKVESDEIATPSDAGYFLIENEGSDGEVIDLSKEFELVYTMTNVVGDTIISTLIDPELSDLENSQVVNAEDVVLPEGWKIASEKMKVGGDYTLYLPYELGFGEEGLLNQKSTSYVVPPFSAVEIRTKVLGQYDLNSTAKKRGQEVLEKAKNEPNTITHPSGFVLTTLEEGSGPKVPAGSDVQAHYILSNSKGEVVENSYMMAQERNEGPPKFSLNGVVDGWQKAVPEMRKGGRYKLVLPYDLAYGESGNGGIPPFETLTFEMEIIDFGKEGTLVQPRKQQQQPQMTEEQMQQMQQQQ
ncbi:MAG: FKBP-type peptidyl-prolyl cis-trans isomerase [Brumimicrobium sp.]